MTTPNPAPAFDIDALAKEIASRNPLICGPCGGALPNPDCPQKANGHWPVCIPASESSLEAEIASGLREAFAEGWKHALGQQSHAGDGELTRLLEAVRSLLDDKHISYTVRCREAREAARAALRAPPAPAADDGEIADKAYALLGAHDVSFPDDGERKDFLCALIDLLTAPPAQSAAGEVKNGHRVGWHWLRLNRGDSHQPGYPAGSWIVVQWRGYGFSTLGVQWADVDSLGDETAWATLGPYLGATPPAGGGGA